jgi:mannose-6-phosphate isomerase-like protein (cupin superfamily)
MKATASELLRQLPGKVTDEWPMVIGGARYSFAPGDCFFVAAGAEHRFVEFSPGFCAWAVFWGPKDGEIDA